MQKHEEQESREKKGLSVVEKGSTFEWVLSIVYIVLTILIGMVGVSISVFEYASRYYGGPKIAYESQYLIWMIGITFLYFIYVYSYLYVKGKILKKMIKMTIDMVIVAFFFLMVQLFLLNLMNVRLDS